MLPIRLSGCGLGALTHFCFQAIAGGLLPANSGHCATFSFDLRQAFLHLAHVQVRSAEPCGAPCSSTCERLDVLSCQTPRQLGNRPCSNVRCSHGLVESAGEKSMRKLDIW
jgi:hypothetical protein